MKGQRLPHMRPTLQSTVRPRACLNLDHRPDAPVRAFNLACGSATCRLLAIARTRGLNNGEPSRLVGWIDALSLESGQTIVNVGTGTAYYTARMDAPYL